MCQWYSRIQAKSGLSQEKLEPELVKTQDTGGRNLRRHKHGQVPNSVTFAMMQSVALKNGWISPLMGTMHIMSPAEFEEWQVRENWQYEMDEQDWALNKRAVELEQHAAALISEARAIQRYLTQS